MERYFTLEEVKDASKNIIQNTSLTYGQQVSQLAKLAENVLDYPFSDDEEFIKMVEDREICDLSEGMAPIAPRYILPDYEKLLKEGCKFLRLTPATNIHEAINNLLIFYHHVPSVTRFPVFIGNLDELLEPFVNDDNYEEAKMAIKLFLIQLDRTIDDSFCHANIGPYETKVGNIILDLLGELQNVTPNLTILYDEDITPDEFGKKAVKASLESANPAFANLKFYNKDFNGTPYGIASCYNALPKAGGAFSLSRIRLNYIAKKSKNLQDMLTGRLPEVVDTFCNFMEHKIDWLVNDTAFFKSNFLVKEGFIKVENFVGLFGVVGLAEAVEIIGEKEGMDVVLGRDDMATEIGEKIMDRLEELVNGFTSKYSPVWNHKFMLHAQVGAANDEETSPGTRIKIGNEPDLYSHIRNASHFQKYFPSGTGDHFPFEETAIKNPGAILDVFKGAFKMNLRYISSYCDTGDLIRVTGYLIKKSDLKKFDEGEQISYDTVQYAQDALHKYGVLDRKVRNA